MASKTANETHWLLNMAHRSIERMRAESTRVVLEVPLEEVSFSKVLIPLAHAENIFMKETNPLVFYASAHPDEDVRLASAEAQILIDDFAVEQALFEPLFRLIDAVVRKEERLDDESARYLATKHRNFVRHGMLLGDEPSHQRLRELRREIARDSSQFHANLTNADGGVWYPREALDGVPERILDSMEVGTGEKEGLLKVSFKNSHLAGVLRYAKRAEIRREFFIANENQLPENVELFRNVVLRRDEVARLLAYGSHAALKLEERMAGSTVVVERFHEDLRMKLQETGVSEGEKLRALKAAELGIDAEKKKVDYWLWDQPYYNRLMVERNYQIDQEKISEWFPLQIVVQRMLAIFEDIFALKFVLVNPLDASQGERPEVWHEDVQVYATYDGDDGGSFMGWLYMDLYTRDGKREQSGNYSLVPGYLHTDGSRQHPSTALLCSFPEPSSTAPSLLSHGEVVTLFHELGHAIHDLVSKTTFACFHGPQGVAVDFGEAPSQMLEYWCWTPEVLKKLSKHYSTVSEADYDYWKSSAGGNAVQPEEILPGDMIASLVAARDVNAAHFYLNQLRISMFDLAVHSPESHEALERMDISAIHHEIRSDVFPPRGPESLGFGFNWAHGQVLNAHLMKEDYSAGYYSYMFSKVSAADMFESVFRQDSMSRTEGLRYRYTVLEKGGSRDAMEMLTGFLGRPPRSDAFNSTLRSTS